MNSGSLTYLLNYSLISTVAYWVSYKVYQGRCTIINSDISNAVHLYCLRLIYDEEELFDPHVDPTRRPTAKIFNTALVTFFGDTVYTRNK